MTTHFRQLALTRFTTAEIDPYRAYRQLRHEVFVGEQSWPDLTDEDPFDQSARLWLATTGEGAVGIVRGLQVVHGFPHYELFEHHYGVLTFFASPVVATINVLAVAGHCRGLIHRVAGTPQHGTVGQLLVLAALADLESLGARVVVATAGGLRPLQLFRSLGFLVLDQPARTSLHPNLILTNVGLVLGSPAHLKAKRGCGFRESTASGNSFLSVLRYFESREAGILLERPLSAFF